MQNVLGLGSSTRLGLSQEKRGLVPTTQWKLLNKKEPWLLGETISASIGQGFNLVTPMQQVSMIAAVANGGMLLKPYLVKRIEEPEGQIREEFFPNIVWPFRGRTRNIWNRSEGHCVML